MANKNLEIAINAQNNASKQLDEVSKSLGNITKENSNMATSVFKGVASWDLLKGALQTVGSAVGKMMNDGRQALQVQKQLNSVLESTKGISGNTADSINEISNSLMKLTGIDDDVITAGQNMLLTFTQIGADVMPQATEAMLNMATAMNGGVQPSAEMLKTTAIQLGKALNDPINGVTTLRRVGVMLTETQEKQVQKFIELGDVASAQKVILNELGTEFGGLAQKMSTPMAQLQTRIGNLGEEIGKKLVVKMDELAEKALKVIDVLEEFYNNNKETINGILTFVGVLATLIATFVTLHGALAYVPVLIKGIAVAFNFLMANPILLFLALLAGGIAYLSVKFGGLSNAMAVIGASLVIMGQVFAAAFKMLGNSIIDFINWVLDKGNKVYNFFADLLKKVNVDIGKADMKIDVKFDTNNNMAKIAEMGALVNQLKSNAVQAGEAGKEAGIKLTPPPTLGAGLTETANKFNDLKEKIADTVLKSVDAFDELEKKIVEIQDKMANLSSERSLASFDERAGLAKLYADQEKKVAEMTADWQKETNQETKDDLLKKLNIEKQALEKHSTILIAYSQQVEEERRKNALTDFERSLEVAQNKIVIAQDEFNRKMETLQKELTAEQIKQATVKALQEQALKEADKYLAKGEKQTAESVNREIEYYNKLADAIARAKAGQRSAGVSLASGTQARATQSTNVTVNVNASNVVGDTGIKALANLVSNKVGQMVGATAKLNP